MRSLKVFSLAIFYSSASNPEKRFSWLSLKVVLQLLQLFGDLLVQSFHFLFTQFRIRVTGPWDNELVHHEAATLGPGGHLLEKAAQGVVGMSREAEHFHVL